jgi:hypothetical protein
MTWKFHEVEGREYVQYYVESDRGVRVEYCGCRSPMHFFEYARGDLGFRFRVDASLPWVTKEEYLKIQKYLGPTARCGSMT